MQSTTIQSARESSLKNLGGQQFDILVIGGGATGLGTAVDAANRGFKTALVEAHDWAKGTSSRSTKLVHGGVRYLEQMDISLVMEALRERGLLHQNASHLVHPLAFIVPRYTWWEGPFYGAGLKLYDALAGKLNLKSSRTLSAEQTIELIPNVHREDLQGGIEYYDGQFDDARLAVNLLQTAQQFGAVAANRVAVVKLLHEGGRAVGAVVRCEETSREFTIRAKVVVNATGIFADSIRRMDDPAATPMIEPAQGVHLVLPKSFLSGETAIMVPHTDDGRVLFVIPWHDRVILGTTDTPMKVAEIEPKPLEEEIGFILRNASRYLQREPQRSDVLSVFAGQRPLVHAGGADGGASKKVSREHVVLTSASGMVSVMGGKWTTYRKMAEDTVDAAILSGSLPSAPCRTEALLVHGASHDLKSLAKFPEWLRCYGSDAEAVAALMKSRPELAAPLHPRLPYPMAVVAWAARCEQARTLEDVLSRRTRSLLLDARATLECSAAVADLLAGELGRNRAWAIEQTAQFAQLARHYLPM
ncbi:MAG: glycerol-3-phosphate dehydrogenase/oxidase [Planctomycetes bacterium]|nr:glycerol-3-phosphate dehydrogenase/oxidase [Planctomycetota bacterium]